MMRDERGEVRGDEGRAHIVREFGTCVESRVDVRNRVGTGSEGAGAMEITNVFRFELGESGENIRGKVDDGVICIVGE